MRYMDAKHKTDTPIQCGTPLLDGRTKCIRIVVGFEERDAEYGSGTDTYVLFEDSESRRWSDAVSHLQPDNGEQLKRVESRIDSGRYKTSESFNFDVQEYIRLNGWVLNRMEKTYVEWRNESLKLRVGKGFETGTKVGEYGVQLTQPKQKNKGYNSTRIECLFRSDSVDDAIGAAVQYMEDMSPSNNRDELFDYFFIGKRKDRFVPTDVTIGDTVEYRRDVIGINIDSGECDGFDLTDETYRGEVIRVSDDRLSVNRYCSSNIIDYVEPYQFVSHFF